MDKIAEFLTGRIHMEKRQLPACPVETTLMLISDRWRALILRDLLTGTKRFGELRRSLSGISQKVLTSNLRDMEANGLLTRKVYAEVPPHVEYTLTELGYSLRDPCSRRCSTGVLSLSAWRAIRRLNRSRHGRWATCCTAKQ